jgi:hypothetical protein
LPAALYVSVAGLPAIGVFQPTSCAESLSVGPVFVRAALSSLPAAASAERGVSHVANFTACSKLAVCFAPSIVLPVASILSVLVDRPPLGVHGVGQGDKVRPLPDVRGTDARRAGIDRPDGVVLCFQVSVYKVEPSEAVLA